MEDLLKQLKLEQYLEALTDAGYEDMDSLEGLTKQDLVDDAGMKPGHANKLVRALQKIAKAQQEKAAMDERKNDDDGDVTMNPVGNSSGISKQTSEEIEKQMLSELTGDKDGFLRSREEKKSEDNAAVVCTDRIGMPPPKNGINIVPSRRSQADTVSVKSNKTILIVGQTGSGKTTLINSMMNYLYGVKSDDPFRYILIKEEFNKTQAQSQTNEVTSYYIEPPKLSYGLTIIDTPGFGDTRGLKQDEKIAQQIKEFFEKGIAGLNAVCFVMNATEARLTPPQRYIFQRLMGIFGKEIKNHILGLFTFCDGAKINALEGCKEAGIPLHAHFKMNNSAFGEDAMKELQRGDKFVGMFWLMGVGAFSDFFKTLTRMDYVSLDSTREVLRQREQLQVKIDSFQRYIKSGIQQLESLRQQISQVQTLEHKIDSNKDFIIKTQVEEEYKVNITDGSYTTLCSICRFTCHYTCGIPNDNQKKGCVAMSGENCTVCPKRCHWSHHQNNIYRWSTRTVTQTKTAHELKAAYTDAKDKRSMTVQMVENMGREFIATQEMVFRLIGQVHQCVQKLQRIALRPNVLNQTEYIQLLISTEKTDQKPGYMERVAQYQKLLKDSERLQEIMNDEYDPFEEYRREIASITKKSVKKDSSWLSTVTSLFSSKKN